MGVSTTTSGKKSFLILPKHKITHAYLNPLKVSAEPKKEKKEKKFVNKKKRKHTRERTPIRKC